MTPLLSLIQTNTYEQTPSNLRLPPILWNAFTVLNKIHGVWRWYRRAELYRNPDTLAQMVAGHVVNFVIGDALILRIAAQCLLVATRILECSQQQASLCRSGKKWGLSIQGAYPKPVKIQWDKSRSNYWLSPSTKHWWKALGSSVWARIERIALCTLKLLKKTFKLSMSIMDAIDALCWSPSTNHDGVIESFVNMTKWLDTIVSNKDELMAGITDNREIIERLLKNSPITYEQLHNGVAKAIEKTEIVYSHAKKVSEFGGGVITDFGKRMANGSMVVMGMSDFRPTVLADKKKI